MVDYNPEDSFDTDSQWIVYWRIIIIFSKITYNFIIYLFKQLVCGFGLFCDIKEKDVKGQVVLITGSANGIGRGLATEFAKRQCNIAIVDLDQKNGEKLAAELKQIYKIKTKFYKVDVSIYSELEKLKDNVEEDLGYVDILVNNAAIIAFMQTLNPKRKPEDISKLIDVNLKAHIYAVNLFLPGMKERKRGHIVATCSLGGISPCAYILDYIASKGGLRFFMDSLYLDLLVKGYDDIIKTSLIVPTLVLTSKMVIKTSFETKGTRLIKPWSIERAGRYAVSNILKNKRHIVMPSFYRVLNIINALPDEASREGLLDMLQVDQKGFSLED